MKRLRLEVSEVQKEKRSPLEWSQTLHKFVIKFPS